MDQFLSNIWDQLSDAGLRLLGAVACAAVFMVMVTLRKKDEDDDDSDEPDRFS